jgi:MYXO-CTERM domain-containing protein
MIQAVTSSLQNDPPIPDWNWVFLLLLLLLLWSLRRSTRLDASCVCTA